MAQQQQRCESAAALAASSGGRRPTASRMKSTVSRRHASSVPTLVPHPASPRNPQLSPLQVRCFVSVSHRYAFKHYFTLFHVFAFYTTFHCSSRSGSSRFFCQVLLLAFFFTLHARTLETDDDALESKITCQTFFRVTELMRSPPVRWSSRSCRSLPPTPTPSYHHPLHPPLPAMGMVAERKKRFEL